MHLRMTRRRLLLGAAAAPWIIRSASAQSFPNRPVRIVIGFPPGGGIDILARIIAPKMSERLGQPVIVDNRPGANGQIATQAVRQAVPDGHTVLFGTLGNLAINQVLYPDRPGVDVQHNFAPVSEVASLSFVMVVGPSMPAKSLSEFIAIAKSKPGQIMFGSSGIGGLPHLCGELLNLQAGIKTVHVPYRGSAPAFSDLIAGQVHYVFDALAIALPHIKAGTLRPLAVTGSQRIPALPNVPLMKETLPEFHVTNWYGMVVRNGTPMPVIQRLQQEVAFALRQPDVAARSASLGLDLLGTTPDRFGAFQSAEISKWAKVVKAADIRVQ